MEIEIEGMESDKGLSKKAIMQNMVYILPMFVKKRQNAHKLLHV